MTARRWRPPGVRVCGCVRLCGCAAVRVAQALGERSGHSQQAHSNHATASRSLTDEPTVEPTQEPSSQPTVSMAAVQSKF